MTMYNFSPGEVPQSVIDGVRQLTVVSQESVSHIIESILKYLTGVGGVNKEVMAEEVANFSSMAKIDIGQAQALVKVLLHILKASYRGALTSAQVQADFQSLTGSVESANVIAVLWSKYVHPPDSSREVVTAGNETRPESAPSKEDTNQPSTTSVTEENRKPQVASDSDEKPAGEAPLNLDDVLEGGGVQTFDELLDVQWSFGVTAASSEPAHVGRTFVRLSFQVLTPCGETSVKKVQLTVSQFYSLLHQLEKARALARFM